ncbi:hypothetical protein FOA52_012820 [Chlamydomonas sp. UWO 241]|nr:hypothetical protein FOA52_012820 [Chlamydomonas sp. UWO 241]
MRTEFTNLVFSGGGIKGVAYAGCFRYMAETGMLARVRNVIGSSVGSVFAMLCCVERDYPTILELVDRITNAVRTRDAPEALANILDVYDKMGITEGAGVMACLGDFVASRFGGARAVSFLDFAKKTGRNLVVVGSNLTRREAEYFSVDTHPDMDVLAAIRISIAVPLLFTPVLMNECLYVDAGLYNHAPYDYFKNETRGSRTLVMHVVDRQLQIAESRNPTNVSEFFNVLVDVIHERLNRKDSAPGETGKNMLYVQIENAMCDSACFSSNFVIDDDLMRGCIDRGYATLAAAVEADAALKAAAH